MTRSASNEDKNVHVLQLNQTQSS